MSQVRIRYYTSAFERYFFDVWLSRSLRHKICVRRERKIKRTKQRRKTIKENNNMMLRTALITCITRLITK